MVRILPALVLILVVSLVLAYFNIFNPPKISQQTVQKTSSPQPTPEDFVNSEGTQGLSSITLRLKSIEDQLSSLSERVKKLEDKPQTVVQKVSQPASSASKKPPLYIPFGGGATATSLDWTTSDVVEVTIDPADYNGYSSMQLEASIKVLSGNGQAFVRLFNNNEKLAILSSEVSTTSENYTWITSDGFKLPTGKKTYRFQLKTLSGYEASVKDSKIRVNF